ncbi:MAG: LuxR C-terminal-related transcriptional regulator [Tepidiformaceae bacterium]
MAQHLPESRGGTPLLRTKFHVPLNRHDRVARGRLIQRLNENAQTRLTLISAPPGFGKTTLLAEWLGSETTFADVAWVSLEGSDNHLTTFWSYIFGALGNVRPAVERSGVIQLLDAPQPPPIETILTLALNEIASEPGAVRLILDDYHVIDSEPIQKGMTFLLDHLPPQLHLVLASRVDPGLALARLRARGELTEIRAADLRFTLEEANDFLNGPMHLGLLKSEVARLEARTEGWASALQLAALSLQGRDNASEFIDAFSGDNRFVVDYLVEEVLDRQSPEVRRFLLRTSILARLSGSLCDAVTGGDDGRSMLETLERRNLFVTPLDDRRRWFRYHQLFSEVLLAHLLEEHSEDVPKLHKRASAWYSSNGEPERAVGHARAAGDLALAAGLIELEAEGIVRRHHPDRLIEWLEPIPDALIQSMPVLSTYYGHALQGVGDMEGSALRLADAERFMVENAPHAVVFDQKSFAMLPALVAVARGYLAMTARDPELTAEFATRALALLSDDQTHWRGTAIALLGLAHWIRGDLEPAQALHSQAVSNFENARDTGLAITSAYHDAELLKARGHLNEAERRLSSSLRFVAQQGGEIRGGANLHLGLSELRCERNDLDGAVRELALAEQAGVYPPRTPFRFLLAQARLVQCRGALEETAALLIEAGQLHVRGAVPDYRPVAAWLARVRALQGRFDKALDWVRDRGLSTDDELNYGQEYEHISLARILLARNAEGDARDARGLLERLLEAARAGKRLGTAREISMLLASVCWASGDEALAISALEPALLGAQPEGFVRLFLDEGPKISPLLRIAAERGIAPDFCRQLLGALVDSPASGVGGLDALSEREAEVLRLLATELSGPAIAGRLVVSLHTLRSHTKNIYGKLGVNSRRAAVRRATELGLL